MDCMRVCFGNLESRINYKLSIIICLNMANVEPNTLRLSESTLGKAFKSKPHLEKYTSRLKALDKDNNGELSLQEGTRCRSSQALSQDERQ